MNAHPVDDLELYALGDLEPSERAAIEAHVAECASCRHTVGEAEESLAALADALPRYRLPQPRRAQRYGALAAAFVAGLILAGGSLVGYDRLHPQPLGDDVRAQVAMTHAHFLHVSLEPVSAGAPAAKVVYARDRRWLYALADDSRRPYDLVEIDARGTKHDLGRLAAHDGSSSLFVSLTAPAGRDEVDLVAGDQVVARGTLR